MDTIVQTLPHPSALARGGGNSDQDSHDVAIDLSELFPPASPSSLPPATSFRHCDNRIHGSLSHPLDDTTAQELFSLLSMRKRTDAERLLRDRLWDAAVQSNLVPDSGTSA